MPSLFLSLWAPIASAQVANGDLPEINAQHFRPTIDGRHTLWTDDASRGTHLSPGFRALFHFTDDPLVYVDGETGETTSLVEQVLQADLLASFAVDRLRLGVDLPLYLITTSDVGQDGGGFGDLAGEAKVTVLDGDDQPVDLAGSLRLTLPTSGVDVPLAARNTGWEATAIVSKNIQQVLLAANVGMRGGPNTELENIRLDDYLVGRAALGYAFDGGTGASIELAGQLPLSAVPSNRAAAPVEWLLGGYRHMGSGIVVRGGGGTGLTSGIMAPDFRLMAGVAYEPHMDRPADRDGDGWLDADDPCPDVAEDLDGVADDGCPEDDPTVIVRVVDEAGALVPEAVVTLTGAGRTVEQGADDGLVLGPATYRAAATAEGYGPASTEFSIIGDEGSRNVTVVLAKARGRLILTVQDPAGNPVAAAITVAGTEVAVADRWEGPVEMGDIPYVVRADGYTAVKQRIEIVDDTVIEQIVVVTPARAVLVGDRIDIRESVYFDTAKATIQPVSFALLDEVAQILADHPELTKLTVEGHTDSRGSAAYNKDLSQRRADSVRGALVDRGIMGHRLQAVGYGEDKPLDAANNATAWEKNRRVDFFVTERSD